MLTEKELEDLLFLAKSVPMNTPETTEMVLKYIKRLEEKIKECQTK
jgi:hypothetical protein